MSLSPSTVEGYLKTLSRGELLDLYKNAVLLDQVGLLPMEAPLRRISKSFLQDDSVLKMMFVGREVYRHFATLYVDEHHQDTHLEIAHIL